MNSQSISNQNAELSAYGASDYKSQHPTLTFRLNNALDSLKHYLFNPYEPHVWQEYNSAGLLRWCAYDPQTQRSAYCSTESEMRSWIEHLHY